MNPLKNQIKIRNKNKMKGVAPLHLILIPNLILNPIPSHA